MHVVDQAEQVRIEANEDDEGEVEVDICPWSYRLSWGLAMVSCSNDNCLGGLAVSVSAMTAPAVMTADTTANAAVQDDALALDLPTKYEELHTVR